MHQEATCEANCNTQVKDVVSTARVQLISAKCNPHTATDAAVKADPEQRQWPTKLQIPRASILEDMVRRSKTHLFGQGADASAGE